MPVYALQEWRQESIPAELPAEVAELIDNCAEATPTSRRKLKKFLLQNGIQSAAEMDYTLRQAYQHYLTYVEQLQQTDKHIFTYDRVKQAYIRQQTQTLQGRHECAWRLEEKVLFIPYHPDAEIAMEFDSVRNRSNMAWDFTRPCSWRVKEQIFTALNAAIERFKELRVREHKLSGLQLLYDFCVEENIEDIEAMDIRQEQRFEQYLTEHTNTESRKMQLLPSLNFCRKTVFLQSREINWQANIWYIERLNLPPHRRNPSGSLDGISFREIEIPENRRYAKEFMKYQLGITGQAVSTITTRFGLIRDFLCSLSENNQNVCDCTAETIERYLNELQNRGIVAKTFNSYLAGLALFFRFLTVRGYIKRVPFQPEYYQQKVIPQHHDRSVSTDVCMEMLTKVYLLPEHLRCMYFHLWCLGLRISEVCTLKGDAYYRQGEDAWIQIYQIKMKNYKRIPISDGLYKIMQVYIKRNGIKPDEYLFKNRNGGAYRSATFRQQMIKFCAEQNIEEGEYLFQSHDYRHTVATYLYDNGVSLQGVRDYLGHDYEEMTQQYIDYIPRKIAKESTEFFKKPGNSLAACLEKGGKK